MFLCRFSKRSTPRAFVPRAKPAQLVCKTPVVHSLTNPRVNYISRCFTPTIVVKRSFTTYIEYDVKSREILTKMGAKTRLSSDLVAAMKNRDSKTANLIRQIKSRITYWEKDHAREAKDEDVFNVMLDMIAESEDTIAEMKKHNNYTAVAKEEEFIAFINRYLPPRAKRSEIEAVVRNVIKEQNATSIKDMGKVMAAAAPQLAGRAFSKEIAEVAKELLSK